MPDFSCDVVITSFTPCGSFDVMCFQKSDVIRLMSFSSKNVLEVTIKTLVLIYLEYVSYHYLKYLLFAEVGSRAAAASKMERFVIISSGLQPLTNHKVVRLGCCSSPRSASGLNLVWRKAIFWILLFCKFEPFFFLLQSF